jgi:hypothetical protein
VNPDPERLDAFCNGCGYYRVTHGDHRPDCTALAVNGGTL